MKFHRIVVQGLALLALHHNAGWSSTPRNGMMLALAEEAGATTPDEYKPPENAENYQFQAEVHRMLDIVVNSLYQNKDVFLRELISNASDALDKFRYLSLTEPEKFAPSDDVPLEIKIEYDEEAHTFTIRDTGIGMTHDEMVSNLGTVARSGTTKFLEALKDKGDSAVNQIGQFGVGFYSAFLVADRITVASKSPLSNEQLVWESLNGESEFHIYPDPRGKTLDRGTEITLHLKEDSLEYADERTIEKLTKHFSEFVVHPIYLRKTETMEVEDEDAEEEPKEKKEGEDEGKKDGEDDLEVEEESEEKPKKMKTVTTHSWDEVNTEQALWTRPKEDITDEEYQSFWHVLNGDEFKNASTWSHFNAEGNINFKSLLYLPDELPQEMQTMGVERLAPGIRLYVRKVLISDEFELLPKYLNFIKGVVDSDDLPLNVNRETLQESKIIQVIRKKLVRKALDMIRQFAKDSESSAESEEAEAEVDADGNVKEPEKKEKEGDSDYIKWYKEFSTTLKIGVVEDEPNQKKIMKLLRFQTLNSGDKFISLDEYVKNMHDWQDAIYMLSGVNEESIKQSPFMEPFIEKNVDVLLSPSPIDEYVFARVKDYEGTKFTDISRENVKFKDEDEDMVKRREKAYKKKFKPLTKWLKDLFGTSVMRVSISRRLGTVPAIASSTQFGNSANMERIMRAQTQGQNPLMSAMKVLEINPRHPLVLKLLEVAPSEEGDDAEKAEPSDEIKDAAWVLHDMALLNGGFMLDDPIAHGKRMVKFMQSQLGVDSLNLEPEIEPPEEEEEAPDMDDMAGDFGGLNMEDFDLDSMNLD